MFDPLPADLAAALDAARGQLGPFANLRFVAETDSTNDLALSLATAGEPEGTAVTADAQRRGRGRRGRDWFSPPGAGVYLSVILRPKPSDRGWPLMTIAAGVAAARAVRQASGLDVELKWPNDLMIGRPWRKLCGVLCETAMTGSRVDAVIVGIGVNLLPAAYPREIADRATSIEAELGRSVDRASLVVALLAEVGDIARRLDAGAHETICAEWRTFGHAGLSGTVVHWQDDGRPRRGRARDLDRDGALVVEVDGVMERLVAGEVAWEAFDRE